MILIINSFFSWKRNKQVKNAKPRKVRVKNFKKEKTSKSLEQKGGDFFPLCRQEVICMMRGFIVILTKVKFLFHFPKQFTLIGLKKSAHKTLQNMMSPSMPNSFLQRQEDFKKNYKAPRVPKINFKKWVNIQNWAPQRKDRKTTRSFSSDTLIILFF